LLQTQDSKLGEEWLEHLVRLWISDAQGAGNESVGLLAVEKDLQIGKVESADAIVRKIDILEVEVPIVELSVGVTGEEFFLGLREIVQSLRADITVELEEPVTESLRMRWAGGFRVLRIGGWGVGLRKNCRAKEERRQNRSASRDEEQHSPGMDLWRFGSHLELPSQCRSTRIVPLQSPLGGFSPQIFDIHSFDRFILRSGVEEPFSAMALSLYA